MFPQKLADGIRVCPDGSDDEALSFDSKLRCCPTSAMGCRLGDRREGGTPMGGSPDRGGIRILGLVAPLDDAR